MKRQAGYINLDGVLGALIFVGVVIGAAVAAMRCYVLFKLGDTAEVPEELL